METLKCPYCNEEMILTQQEITMPVNYFDNPNNIVEETWKCTNPSCRNELTMKGVINSFSILNERFKHFIRNEKVES